jgi:hypothetical protein
MSDDLPVPTNTTLEATQLADELLNIKPYMWDWADKRKRGKSCQVIAKEHNAQHPYQIVSAVEVKKVLDRILNVNHHLSVNTGNELRQALLDQLDDYLENLYEASEAEIGVNPNKLSPKCMKLALDIWDRKMKLLGVAPAEKVEVSVSGIMDHYHGMLKNTYQKFLQTKVETVEVAHLEKKDNK